MDDEEAETAYAEGSECCKKIQAEIAELNRVFGNEKKNKLKTATETLDELDEIERKETENHEKLLDLKAKFPSYNTRSYFKLDQHNSVGMLIESLREKCKKVRENHANASMKKIAEVEEQVTSLLKVIEDNNKAKKKMEKEMSEMKRTLENREPQPRGSEDALHRALKSVKTKVPEPKCPKDLKNWMTFETELNFYMENEHAMTGDDYKLFCLQNICKDQPKAYEICQRYSNKKGGYKACWAELQKRFGSTKKILSNELEKMVSVRDHIKANEEPHIGLRKTYDVMTAAIINIQNLIMRTEDFDEETTENDIKASCYDALLFALTARGVDPKTMGEFINREKISAEKIPTAEELLSAIDKATISFEQAGWDVETKRSSVKTTSKATSKRDKKQTEKKKGCLVCNLGNHQTFRCRKILELPVKDRMQFVKDKKICTNCLQAEWKKCDCFKSKDFKSYCRKCPKRHNDILHVDEAERTQQQCVSTSVAVQQTIYTPVRPTLLADAIGKNKCRLTIRLLKDTGAEDTLITTEAAQSAGLKLTNTYIETETFSGQPGPPITKTTTLTIVKVGEEPTTENSITINNVLVTKSVGNLVPNKKVVVNMDCPTLKNIKMSDPGFDTPGRIDVILGINAIAKLSKAGLIKTNHGIFENSILGWSYSGEGEGNKTSCSMETTVIRRRISAVRTKRIELTPENIMRFFNQEMEEEERENFVQTCFDQKVIKINNRYYVKVPYIADMTLGDSEKVAMAITRRMYDKLSEKAQEAYREICNDMKKRGWAFPPKKKGKNAIPNFLKQTDSMTTPYRLLMKCDQKTSNGNSVNDIQHTGPKLQKSIPMQIINFRLFEVAITGDLAKMFWNTFVYEEDQDYQHTFMIFEKNGKLVEMVLPMLIFGMASSPFLANATLLQLAKDVEEELPIAAMLLRTSFYVDDLMKSFRTIEEAIEAFRQLAEALKTASIVAKKCTSNYPEALKYVEEENCLETTIRDVACGEKDFDEVNALGVKWQKREDYLHYKVKQLTLDGPITWRKALGFVGKIYDPNGFLMPVITKFRIMIQEICAQVQDKCKNLETAKQKKAVWDVPVDEETASRFTKCANEIHLLEEIKIPRWLKCTAPAGKDYIIVFYDASMEAYGFVAYWRHVPEDKSAKALVTLLGAGSRVAPLSQKKKEDYNQDDITLPKNELNSADEAAAFIKKVKSECAIPEVTIWAFGDSLIANAWMYTQIKLLKVYVANRVKRIVEQFGENTFWIRGADNPADEVSRGQMPSEFIKNKRYLEGPAFLQDRDFYPTMTSVKDSEKAKTTIAFMTEAVSRTAICKQKSSPMSQRHLFIVEVAENISNWDKTVQTVRLILKWTTKLHEIRSKKSGETMKSSSRVEKINEAENEIFRAVQHLHYREEIKLINKGEFLQKGILKKVTPFLDNNKILRVGGRIDNTLIPYQASHPIILPKLEVPNDKDKETVETCSLTKKIIIWAHQSTFHGNHSKTTCLINTRFYIPNIRNAVKYVIFRCMQCSKQKAEMSRQLMGNVQKVRLCGAPMFWMIQLDFMGPFTVRDSTRRISRRNKDGEMQRVDSQKNWIMVIVDMPIGAVINEVVSDLTPQAFLQSFQRFTSERGVPKYVYFDNATTFVAASKMIKKAANMMTSEEKAAIVANVREIEKVYTKLKVTFAFNQEELMEIRHSIPYAANTNGGAEVRVKLCKELLMPMIQNMKPTSMELQTFGKLCQGAMNSAPPI
jgi:hypothetical protein